MNGQPKIVTVDNASYIEVSVETPLYRHKIPNDDSYLTSAKANYFVRGESCVPNHHHQM